MIISATTASNLISRIDPRYLSGVGTLLSAAALYGFCRITVPEDPRRSWLAPRVDGRPGRGAGRRRQLLDPGAALRGADGLRHGAQLRAPHPRRGAPPARRRTPASAPACSTRCSRSVARSGWRRSARCRCTSHRRGPTRSRRPSRPPLAAARLRGSCGQLASLGSFTEGATMAFLVGLADDARPPPRSCGSSSTSSTRSWPPSPRPRASGSTEPACSREPSDVVAASKDSRD